MGDVRRLSDEVQVAQTKKATGEPWLLAPEPRHLPDWDCRSAGGSL